MIPGEAVEAAAKRLAMDDGWPDDWKRCRSQAKSALEAAAPHLMAADRADIWDEGNLAGKGASHRFERTNPYRKEAK